MAAMGSGRAALTSITNVLALAGGVAIKRNNEIVAALGVGGSPGGDKDEAYAGVGAARFRIAWKHRRRLRVVRPTSRSDGLCITGRFGPTR